MRQDNPPSLSRKYSALQFSHEDAAVVDFLPTGQSSQLDELVKRAYLPALHESHEKDVALLEYLP